MLASIVVRENAWFVIHGVSCSAYHVYKSATKAGCICGSHGNARFVHPWLYIIQTRVLSMILINENVNQMPYEFRMIAKNRVKKLKVVPSTMKQHHTNDLANEVNIVKLPRNTYVLCFYQVLCTKWPSRLQQSVGKQLIAFLWST